MSIQSELLAEIESFLSGCDMKETTFGRLAVNDGKFVGRLRAGKNIGIGTVERVRGYIAEHTANEAVA
jgi:hypothetical protein